MMPIVQIPRFLKTSLLIFWEEATKWKLFLHFFGEVKFCIDVLVFKNHQLCQCILDRHLLWSLDSFLMPHIVHISVELHWPLGPRNLSLLLILQLHFIRSKVSIVNCWHRWHWPFVRQLDDYEPRGSNSRRRKRRRVGASNVSFRSVQSSSPVVAAANIGATVELNELRKKKLRLECTKLELEIEKLPLECAKFELEIQKLQRDLLAGHHGGVLWLDPFS